jgi:hypothetical protein
MMDVPKGEWKGEGLRWILAIEDDKKLAVLICPNGHWGLLQHEISEDGIVLPSVVCPEKDCPFHEFVRLLEWS